MIVINPNSECNNARPYYYNYLSEDIKDIPQSIYAHIKQCSYCQQEVKSLKIILATNKTYSKESLGKTDAVIAEGLKLHFAYEGNYVTCRNVKPFLPSLADPSLEIRVPTPITTHIDNCPKCTEELDTMRQLNLSHKQLCKLGHLFAEKPAEDAISCSQAQAAILAVVTMVFRKTNAEVLKHLCSCPDCRELLYKYRETVREKLPWDQRVRWKFPCEEVSASDIFDYCFPYGIDPGNDQYAKFRTAFTSHARACPKCLGKMQELHRTVYSILERQESGIVTCFKVVDESARDSIASSPDDVYKDWPIEVEVLDKSKLEPNIVAFPQKLKQKASAVNLRQFRIPVAAAIILIAVGLFFFSSTPVAKAVDLGQIYNALERIKNVCVTAFVPKESKPTQEIWTSRTLKIRMFKTETECVLLDIEGKFRKVKDLNTGSITMAELDEDMLVKIEEAIEGPVGLLPFDDISEVPEDAKWQQVTGEAIETIAPSTQVYDLMWMEKALDGSIVYKKWRGHIDTETKLPKRVEQWIKLAKEKEYELKTIMKVTYPTAIEIQAVIEDAGF